MGIQPDNGSVIGTAQGHRLYYHNKSPPPCFGRTTQQHSHGNAREKCKRSQIKKTNYRSTHNRTEPPSHSPPFSTSSKGRGTKEESRFKNLLGRGEVGERGKDPARHDRALPVTLATTRATPAARRQRKLCNNLKTPGFLLLTSRGTAVLLRAVVNPALQRGATAVKVKGATNLEEAGALQLLCHN